MTGEPETSAWDWAEHFRSAARAGITSAEYDRLTPWETWAIVEAHNERMQAENDRRLAEQEDRVAAAYITAMWAAQWFGKKHPKPLKTILESMRRQKPEQPDHAALLESMKAMNMALGGTTY